MSRRVLITVAALSLVVILRLRTETAQPLAPQVGVRAEEGGPTGGSLPLQREAQSKHPAKQSLFDSAEKLAKLEKALTHIRRNLREERGNEEFQASGLDTKENFEEARGLMKAEYEASLSRESVTAKVLAMHLITLSKHLDGHSCLEIVSNSMSLYRGTSDERIKQAHLWDILSVSKRCGHLDRAALAQFHGRIEDSTLHAQVGLALAN